MHAPSLSLTGLTGPPRPASPAADFGGSGARPGVSFAGFRLEADGTLFRGHTQVHLPPKELAALRLLIAHAGQIVTPQQLKQSLWGDVHVSADSVPKCLSSLRARLEPENCIQTVYKRGYRLTAEVKRHERAQPAPLPRLAIAPFIAGYGVPEYLGPSVADETTTRSTRALSSVVSIVARDSVFMLAFRGLTAQQIGEALRADLVLTGTLRALPGRIRLRAEMIRIEDGTQIWVEDLLVEQNRFAGLESELVNGLVFRLSAGLLSNPRSAPAARADNFLPLGAEGLSISAVAAPEPESKTFLQRREAYELFQRARHEWQILRRHHMQDSLQQLIRAVELDPSLIPAKVELVSLCITQALYGYISPAVAADLVRRTIDSVPDLYVDGEMMLPALAWLRFHFDRNLPEAIRVSSLCAHLPHSAYVTRERSMFALSRHRFGEAIAVLRAAIQEDPYTPWMNSRLAWALHLDGQVSESMEEAERCISRFPESEGTGLYCATILSFQGETVRGLELAKDISRRRPSWDCALAIEAYALVRAGRTGEAREILERLEWLSRERFVMGAFIPAIHVALGNHDAALASLRESNAVRCPWFFQMLADPRLKPLHGHPEFESFRAILTGMEAEAAE